MCILQIYSYIAYEENSYVLQPLVNQIDQLTHQVDDVTTDQLMTTPYSGKDTDLSGFTRALMSHRC